VRAGRILLRILPIVFSPSFLSSEFTLTAACSRGKVSASTPAIMRTLAVLLLGGVLGGAAQVARAADEFAYYLHLVAPAVLVASGELSPYLLDAVPPIAGEVRSQPQRLVSGETAFWGPFVSAAATASTQIFAGQPTAVIWLSTGRAGAMIDCAEITVSFTRVMPSTVTPLATATTLTSLFPPRDGGLVDPQRIALPIAAGVSRALAVGQGLAFTVAVRHACADGDARTITLDFDGASRDSRLAFPDDADPEDCSTAIDSDQPDQDGDGIGDVCDNCPSVANADQIDSDDDGRGDACSECLPGGSVPPSCTCVEADCDDDGDQCTIDSCREDDGCANAPIRGFDGIRCRLAAAGAILEGASEAEIVLALQRPRSPLIRGLARASRGVDRLETAVFLRKPARVLKRAVRKLSRSLDRVQRVVDRRRGAGIAEPVADDLTGQVGTALDLIRTL
jgi:hypothetical protein